MSGRSRLEFMELAVPSPHHLIFLLFLLPPIPDYPLVLPLPSPRPVMAAWFRLKFPHVAAGAIASSAPILQYEDVVPADIFNRIVSNDFKVRRATCLPACQPAALWPRGDGRESARVMAGSLPGWWQEVCQGGGRESARVVAGSLPGWWQGVASLRPPIAVPVC